MFSFIRKWREGRILRQSPIDRQLCHEVIKRTAALKRLSRSERKHLIKLAMLFLHYKEIVGAHELEVSQEMAVTIALQACLPILNLGLDYYDGWYSVIVYPSGFAPERKVMDEYGVVHYVQQDQLGEAWLRGPVILSWSDTERAGELDGENLVIHEFAHKLDMLNGVANGFPPLHKKMKQQDWIGAFTNAYEDFSEKCHQHKNIGVDCYASESPAEFFAVMSEVFFETPGVLIEHYPQVHQQFCLYYRQEPKPV